MSGPGAAPVCGDEADASEADRNAVAGAGAADARHYGASWALLRPAGAAAVAGSYHRPASTREAGAGVGAAAAAQKKGGVDWGPRGPGAAPVGGGYDRPANREAG